MSLEWDGRVGNEGKDPTPHCEGSMGGGEVEKTNNPIFHAQSIILSGNKERERHITPRQEKGEYSNSDCTTCLLYKHQGENVANMSRWIRKNMGLGTHSGFG
jgi:hypothetical protein